jgi:threonine/homoserine/homoserine lactone efflux protein
MVHLSNILQGIVIGFSIAAPVGPIGVLCIRRTLAEGMLFGFVSGLGAATADAVYGAIAGLGLTFISNAFIGRQTWLRLLGGLFLCWLGTRTFLSQPSAGTSVGNETRLLGAFASTFFLTLTNPMTIVAFAGVFAGLGLGSTQAGYVAAAFLVLGVFAGSALWWLILSATVGFVRSRFTPSAMRWVNRIAGVVIAGFGLAALLTLRA